MEDAGGPELHCLFLPFFYAGKVIFAYVASAFYVYLYVPTWDIIFAFKNLCCHAGFKNSEQADIQAMMPAKKLFEQIGEAVPQFSIAATFYALNWYYISFGNKLMGAVTMTLSLGSIMMGLVKGIMALYSREETLKSLFTKGTLTTLSEEELYWRAKAIKRRIKVAAMILGAIILCPIWFPIAMALLLGWLCCGGDLRDLGES